MRDEYFKKRIEIILVDSKISKINRDILKKYDTHGKFQQSAIGTRVARLSTLRQLAIFSKKNFKKLTKEDIQDYFSSLGELQPKTWSTKGAFIKAFFKWLYDEDEYPSNVKWINTTVKTKNYKLPSDLLTKTEIKAMIEATDNLLDKAFISVLYESACRIGEIANLKIKDVSIDQYGSAIVVNGKTGMRRIRLIESSPDLVLWINNHPKKEDREAPLFINLHDNNNQYGKALNDYSVRRIITKLVKRAGITKRVHAHLFRHTRLTELAKDFSESELKIIAGWAGGSTMAAVYVHLTGGDIEKKFLEKNGLINKKTDNPDEFTLKPIKCSRCNEINPATARFCYTCGMALDIKAAMEIDNKKSELQTNEPQFKESETNNEFEGFINYIIKEHPESVLEFLKENNNNRIHLPTTINTQIPLIQTG